MQKIKKVCISIVAIVMVLISIQPLMDVIQTYASPIVHAVGTHKDNPIKVLKIIPGEFVRANWTGVPVNNKTGVQAVKQIDNSYIELELMTMPEFIGKTTQLNGYYDVIQIDNMYDGLLETDVSNIWDGPRGYSYSQIEDNSIECMYNSCGVDSKTYLPENNSNVGTNYAENDITKRKAQEIIDFANSGQIVYYDETIGSRGNMENSNLVQVLYSGLKKVSSANFYKYEPLTNSTIDDPKLHSSEGKVSLAQVVSDYQKNNMSRVSFDVKAPTSNDVMDKRELNFTVVAEAGKTNLTANLFLDIDGDGLFSDNEKVTTLENVEDNFDIQSLLPENFLGLLPWKIELDTNGVKSYQTGYVEITTTNPDEVRKINVLQLTTYSVDGTNEGMWKGLDEQRKKILKDAGYELDITIKVLTPIDWNNGHTIEVAADDFDFLKFDYIILGMDSDEWKTSASADSDEMQKIITKLVHYADAGGGMLFTSKTIANRTNDHFSRLLTQNFRSELGQSRFFDFTRANTAIEGNRDATVDFSGDSIPYEDISSNDSIYGFVKANSVWSHKRYPTNVAPTTLYPFDVNGSSQQPEVSGVPTSVYQLNLEDEKVIPLYNTDSEGTDINASKLDTRNNYAMYQRENLTFMLVGGNTETVAGGNLELILNTIVNANRVPRNSGPKVIASETPEYVIKDQKWTIPLQVSASDPDGDSMEVFVKMDKNGQIIYDNHKTDVQSNDILAYVLGDTNTNIKDVLNLTIYAIDEHGNKSNVINRTITTKQFGFVESIALPDGIEGLLTNDDLSVNRTLVSSALEKNKICSIDINLIAEDVKNIEIAKHTEHYESDNVQADSLKNKLVEIGNTFKYALNSKLREGITKITSNTTVNIENGNSGKCDNKVISYTAQSGLLVDLKEGTITVGFENQEWQDLAYPYVATVSSKTNYSQTQTNQNGTLRYTPSRSGSYSVNVDVSNVPDEFKSIISTTQYDASGATIGTGTTMNLSYKQPKIKILYIMGDKPANVLQGEITLGLDTNQFMIDIQNSNVTIARDSDVKLAAEFTLQGKPNEIKIYAPNSTHEPVLSYAYSEQDGRSLYSSVPANQISWNREGEYWIGRPSSAWSQVATAIRWEAPSEQSPRKFYLSWSMQAQQQAQTTTISIDSDDTQKTLYMNTYGASQSDPNIGQQDQPDLY